MSAPGGRTRKSAPAKSKELSAADAIRQQTAEHQKQRRNGHHPRDTPNGKRRSPAIAPGSIYRSGRNNIIKHWP
jgi:hypothetical protein